MDNVFLKYIPIGCDNKIRVTIVVNMVLVWLLFFVQVTPIVQRNIPIILQLFLLLVWFFSTVLERGGPLPTIKDKIVFYSFLFWIIEIIWWLVGLSGMNPAVYFIRASIFAIPFVSVYVLRCYSLREKEILLFGMKFIVLANLISNVYLYVTNPRLFYVFGSYGSVVKKSSNIGSTSFIFVCILFIVITMIGVLNVKFSYRSLVNFVLMLLFSYHIIFQNHRATAFIIFIVLILSVLLVTTGRIKDNIKMKMFFRFLLGMMICIILVIPFLTFISRFFSDAYMGSRLASLLSFLSGEYSGGASGDSFSSRTALMQAGLGTIFDNFYNFLFGIGEFDYGTYNLKQLINAGVSNHSELIDSFTYYGVFGGVVYILFFKSIVNFVLQHCASDQMRRQCMISLIIIFIYSILNKIFSGDIMYMLILFFPLSISMISMKKQNLVLLSNEFWIGKVKK